MLTKQPFGRTGHHSTRLIFGSWAISQATPAEADEVLGLLLAHGINHIDTAPMYGKAEQHVGRWMDRHRDRFFLATKTRSRAADAAWKNLKNSLERLRVDQVDLWQMHGLTNPAGWEKAMGPGGALEALVEAREKGLVRYLGVTGHGKKAAAMALQSLERFDFDSVMLNYNYVFMQDPRFAADFLALQEVCQARKVALQTFMAIAARPWNKRDHAFNTYFYEPLVDQAAIDPAVHWVMGNATVFLMTVGDMRILPQFLDATERYSDRPSEEEMAAVTAKYDIQSIFN